MQYFVHTSSVFIFHTQVPEVRIQLAEEEHETEEEEEELFEKPVEEKEVEARLATESPEKEEQDLVDHKNNGVGREDFEGPEKDSPSLPNERVWSQVLLILKAWFSPG